MPAPDPKPLTRDELARFLPTAQAIRTFERMMTRVGIEIPEEMADVQRKSTLTTRGDVYVRGMTDVERLPLGVNGTFLGSNGTDLTYLSITEAAQDAVGAALLSTASITLAYNDAINQISAEVSADAIGDDKLRNSAALSVIGRSVNSIGDPADIVAANDGEVFRRSGVTLGFGQVATAGLADGAATNAKLADMADGTIKGRASGAGAGDPVDLTPAQAAAIISAAVASALNLASGVYTPTLTNTTNLSASTAFQCQFLRVGSVVVVSGQVNADPTAAGAVRLDISLPVASNIGASENLGGVGFSSGVAGLGAAIRGVAATDVAAMEWVAVDTANQTWAFILCYSVI